MNGRYMHGSYVLILNIITPTRARIGSLGAITFEQGNYIYIGSALNNLEKRIERHLKKQKKKRWHIDYLTTHNNVMVEKVFIKESELKEECEIAKYLSNFGLPVNKFGSSDCRCSSHFYKIESIDIIQWRKLGMKEYEKPSPSA